MYRTRELSYVGDIFGYYGYGICYKCWKKNQKYLQQISEEHNVV